MSKHFLKTLIFSAIITSSFCISAQSFAMAKKPVSNSNSNSQDSQDDEASPAAPVTSSQSHSPVYNPSQSVDMTKYDHLDPQRIVPTVALSNAVKYFDTHKSTFKNQSYMTIIDMTQSSNNKRMYVINMKTGAVVNYHAAHGRNSDPNDTTYATQFSNQDGSRMTSLGFYATGSQITSSHGISMLLRGLESTNSNAMEREIIMHGADYVTTSHTGRSWGCPAVEPRYIAGLVGQLQNASLLYIWKK